MTLRFISLLLPLSSDWFAGDVSRRIRLTCLRAKPLHFHELAKANSKRFPDCPHSTIAPLAVRLVVMRMLGDGQEFPPGDDVR
jgi:hypothetical protein